MRRGAASLWLRLLGVVVVFVSAPLVAGAQPAAGKVPRVGLLGVSSAAGYARQIEAMRQGFRGLGYVEGQKMVIDYRWAEGRYDQLPALAAELIRLQPDVLISSGPGTRVLKAATTTIPIVMAVGGDAVATGLVASLARPGGNITGSTSFGPELSAKRLELLKAALPRLTRVGVLLNPDSVGHRVDVDLVRRTAARLSVELLEAPARSPREFGDAFAVMLRRRAEGMVMLVADMRRLGELSSAKHLPGAGSDEYARGGGLLAYGASFPELWRSAPYFVDRILRTARALGLPIQPALLLRADQVIE